MSEKGKTYTVVIAVYTIIKSVLNLIIDFNSTNIVSLIVTAAVAFLLVAPSSTIKGAGSMFKYANYIAAVYMGLTVIAHISYNLANLPSTWLYTLEAVLDIAAIAILCAQKDVKSFFKLK
jgi:hypothetical protein